MASDSVGYNPVENETLETKRVGVGGEIMLATSVVSSGFVVLWAALYLVLIITLGLMSIRKGHWVMFIIGFFLPIFWLIGALLPRRR